MAHIVEDYVSFEVAKLLKEKGFDSTCNGYYNQEKLLERVSLCSVKNTLSSPFYFDCIPAPTLQMAMKWLREVHNIFITIEIKGDPWKVDFIYYKWSVAKYCKIKIDRIDNNLTSPEDYWIAPDEEEETYERTCEAALNYCLEHLI